MPPLLYGIAVAALLSITSLLVVLLRVSPLSAPAQALPAFVASMFLTVITVSTLVFYALWHSLKIHQWDDGRKLSVSLREGVFLGFATFILLLFHLGGILNWWIGLCIYAIFVFIELALHS